MKKLIIIFCLQTVMCLYVKAQNFRHSLPMLSIDTILVREDSIMYSGISETTVSQSLVSGTETNTKVRKIFLYIIPSHLRDLRKVDIDRVMKGDTVKTIKWSWFLIWDASYTKYDFTKCISKHAINISIYAFIGFLVLFYLSNILFTKRKERVTLASALDGFEEKYIWILPSCGVGVITTVVAEITMKGRFECTPFQAFAFIPYGVVIGFIIHILVVVFRRKEEI